MDIIEYFPPKANYFLVVSPDDCRGNLVSLDGAQEKSMKQEGRGQSTTFERMTEHKDINVNQLRSVGSKMTSQIQVNLNPQSISQQTHPEVARQLQGTRSEEGGVGGSPMAGMILSSLAYEFHPLTKPSQA